MLFAGEQQVAEPEAFCGNHVDRFLGLIGRNDLVFVALEEYDGHRKPHCMVDWRARQVKIPLFQVRSDEPVEIAGFELVGVPGERLQVADAIVAAAQR